MNVITAQLSACFHSTLLLLLLISTGSTVLHAAPQNASLNELRKLYERPESIPYPEDNKFSEERAELGKLLFFDPRLSGSQVMSCASCHNPSFGWEDGLGLAVGHGHKKLGRGTPTVLNLAWAPKLFWDGRASSLEEQALGPIQSPGEMNMALEDAGKTISSIEGYRALFAKAYPGEKITPELIAKAIATFERGVVSGEAPFDRWIKGDEKAISKEAKEGFLVYNTKALCAECHSGWSFTDHSFHDIGIDDKDIGRGAHLKLSSMQHAFKTPTLRNIEQRAPYMHNGSEKTLEEVVEFYNRGGDAKRESVGPMVKELKLTKQEIANLVAFMRTLTSIDEPIEIPVLPN